VAVEKYPLPLTVLATTAVGSEHGTLFSIGPWDLRADAFPSFAMDPSPTT
jgi:hypothetical protein